MSRRVSAQEENTSAIRRLGSRLARVGAHAARVELAAAGVLLALAACSPSDAPGSAAASGGGESPFGPALPEPREERVIVRGTTLDAGSFEPLPGVRVTAPDGATTVSDASGRFEFVGLPEGLSGSLAARADDGRTAENPLRPLARGVLEVVLRLRRP